jgi:hypothetical protein
VIGFIMERYCVLCEVQTEAKEKIYDLNILSVMQVQET